jgi:hypothetical protein
MTVGVSKKDNKINHQTDAVFWPKSFRILSTRDDPDSEHAVRTAS